MLNHVYVYRFIMFGEEELVCLTEEEHIQQNGNSYHEQSGCEVTYLGKLPKQSIQ